MKRARRKFNRVSDYLRRNVLSYRYIKKNVLMTLLVVVLSVMVFAVVRYGETADPYADELYLAEEINIELDGAAIMSETSIGVVMDSVRSSNAQMVSRDNGVVASSPSGNTSEAYNGYESQTQNENFKREGTLTADGVRVRAEALADADVLQVTSIGDVYEVQSETEDWVEIVLEDGSTGFVAADYIVVANVVDGNLSLDE